MKGLESYKLDRAFSDGVEIRLDGAPDVVFLVRLPSQYNRQYTQALYAGMDIQLNDEGSVDTGNLMVAKYSQEDAFIKHCVLSVDGEPLPDDFAEKYPSAVTELVEKSSELAAEIEKKVSHSVGKSQPTSTGKSDGSAKNSSTQSLSSAVG